MKTTASLALIFVSLLLYTGVAAEDRQVPWKLDANYRHAPPHAAEAWSDRKFGMMIHWGVYSVLGVEASSPLKGTSKEFRTLYSTLYQVFNPTGFDADEWAALAERAGMKYFVVTTKHPDGFCMWDTKTKTRALRRSPGAHALPGIGPVEQCYIHYGIMDTPYKKDVVGALVQAFRKRGLGVGLYYAHVDWTDPDFRWDQFGPTYDPSYSQQSDPEGWERFISRQREQLRELCSNYGKLDVLWFDGSWPGTESFRPHMVEIIKMMRNLQPDVMMNRRGIGPFGDFGSAEGGVPQGSDKKDQHEVFVEGQYTTSWETVDVLGSDWAYSPTSLYRPKEWLVETLVDVAAKGGNFMAGISPMSNGQFPRETVERLEYVGDWLRVNGETIYKSRRWSIYREGDDVRFTRSKDGRYVYAISLKWPGAELVLQSVRALEDTDITMLGVDRSLKWHQDEDGLVIEIPQSIGENRPCEQAYAFKIEAQHYQEQYE